MVLSQNLLFTKQENGEVYECIAVLMRVDSQVDDKDLREKMKICKQYTPLDFGIEREFAMMKHALPVSTQVAINHTHAITVTMQKKYQS